MLLAGRAIFLWPLIAKLLERIVPHIEMNDAPVQFSLADDELDGLRGADAGHGADQRPDDARRVAGGARARRGHLPEEAADAGRLAGNDGLAHAVAGDRPGVNPGDVMFETGIVEQIARLEIVRAVHHQRRSFDEPLNIFGVDIGHDAFHLDVGVHSSQLPFGGDGFGQIVGQILLIKEQLPLEVVQFDKIPIHHRQMAHARPGQVVGNDRPGRPAADDGHPGGQEFLLPRDSDAGEDGLAEVAGEMILLVWLLLIHRLSNAA